MDRVEQFQAVRARGLGYAQIVFTSITLIVGIVQAALSNGIYFIGPFLYVVFQVAPIACGIIASRTKGKGIIIASMVLNILTAIFASFSQLCYNIAFLAISSRYLGFYYGYYYDYYPFGEVSEAFVGTSAIGLICGLALFIINIWAAVLCYVVCGMQPQAFHAPMSAQGPTVIMQTSQHQQAFMGPQMVAPAMQGQNTVPGVAYPPQAVPGMAYPPQAAPPPNYADVAPAQAYPVKE